MDKFSVTLQVSETNKDTAVVKVVGEVSIGNYRELLLPFEAPENAAVKWWVVDMGDCTFMSSAGISVLLRGLHLARERGGAFALADANPRLRSMFRLAGLAKAIPQFDSVDEALESFKKG